MSYQKWNFQNGCLMVGLGKNQIKTYVTRNSQSLENYIISQFTGQVYTDDTKTQYTDECYVFKTLKLAEYDKIPNYNLKTSKNNEYCAVYSELGHHCDFYQQISGKATFNYLFTLLRNTYRTQDWILEFVIHPDTQQPLILFNSEHGQLNIYDLTGQQIYTPVESDLFFKHLEWVDDNYFLLHVWIWHPIDMVNLYNLDQFLRNPKDYNPTQIWMDGLTETEITDDKIIFLDQPLLYPVVKDGQIHLNHKVNRPKDLEFGRQ